MTQRCTNITHTVQEGLIGAPERLIWERVWLVELHAYRTGWFGGVYCETTLVAKLPATEPRSEADRMGAECVARVKERLGLK